MSTVLLFLTSGLYVGLALKTGYVALAVVALGFYVGGFRRIGRDR